VVRLGMECYRLTYSLRSMLAQNCRKKTAQKVGSCVDRACRCSRPALFQHAANALRAGQGFDRADQPPREFCPRYSTPRTFTITRFGRCPSNSA
jgi:hypothetical protein